MRDWALSLALLACAACADSGDGREGGAWSSGSTVGTGDLATTSVGSTGGLESTGEGSGETTAGSTGPQETTGGGADTGSGGAGGPTGLYDFAEQNAMVFAPDSIHQQAGPVAVIVGFHGAGDSKTNFMDVILGGGSWKSLAENEGIVIVTFQGTAGGQSVWEYPIEVSGWPLQVGTGDISRVTKTLNYLAENYNVDTRRIYSVGFSMGATMSAQVALHMDAVFAAYMATAQGLPVSYDAIAPASGYKVPGLWQGDPADQVYASVPYTVDMLTSNGHVAEVREFPGTGHVGSWMSSSIYDPGPQDVWDWLKQWEHS